MRGRCMRCVCAERFVRSISLRSRRSGVERGHCVRMCARIAICLGAVCADRFMRGRCMRRSLYAWALYAQIALCVGAVCATLIAFGRGRFVRNFHRLRAWALCAQADCLLAWALYAQT